MISSTFADFVAHRAALMRAIAGMGLHPIAMEQDSARPSVTVLQSSLEKVRDAAAYVGIIGFRYGTIPESSELNPERLSLTELEFREARRLNRPMLLFIMGPDHDVKPRAVEQDPEKLDKLNAFREDAKRASGESGLDRVYKVFNSLGEFETAAAQALAELRDLLGGSTSPVTQPALPALPDDGIPMPPGLYAEPPYLGSHKFVGRVAQLATLDTWASPAEPHPVLLFEAIGGTGKSMLTWEWTIRHAAAARGDWAGRFWYSFYERGAVMADFCGRALAYMTGRPIAHFKDRKQPELSDLLLRQLRSRPWLLVLDGLERVLVAYHRFDAAQVADEQAGTSDEIAERDPSKAIRPLDDQLLRDLATAEPSKILITSRLPPRALLNSADRPIPGVLRERLPGLRPAEAEALLRECGVSGDSDLMRDFLRRHCDCHPLVTGVVAGLVCDYIPARGDFDIWATDPDHGGRLDVGDLDLMQKRNHILRAALDALPERSRELLSTVSLLAGSFDYATIDALNPAATDTLAATVRDLERRGLLQYDRQAGRWDLHPVVRAVASRTMEDQDRDQVGQRIIDHFSQRSHDPYANATTLEDLQHGIAVVRTLLQLGRHAEAWRTLDTDLADALLYNVEAYAELLFLLRPLFIGGWSEVLVGLEGQGAVLANTAGFAFLELGQLEQSIALFTLAARHDSRRARRDVPAVLLNAATAYFRANRLVMSGRSSVLALRFAELLLLPDRIFVALLFRFGWLALTGRDEEAEEHWNLLDPMGRAWSRSLYRQGDAEFAHLATFQLPRGRVTEESIAVVQELAETGLNRGVVRGVHRVRGEWCLTCGEPAGAAEAFQEAIRMANEAGVQDPASEARLALAQLQLGQRHVAQETAARLSQGPSPAHLPLADLWRALGDIGRARTHACAAYRHAWADGEPYVRRHQLDQAAELLRRLEVEIPDLAPHDPREVPKEPWEREIEHTIERLSPERPSTLLKWITTSMTARNG